MGGFVVAVPRRAHVTQEVIASAVEASAPRAPDGVNHVVTPDGVLMVQCLFANTPESVGEVLPIHDPSGQIWLVKRGHLGNIDDLRHQLCDLLPGDPGAASDAQVMLAAYREWGREMGGRLVGEFTIAVWDARDKALFVLRDHFGIRGCFVHDGPDWYVVASEPAQVLAIPGVPDDLDEYGLVDYISGNPVDPELTLYTAIRCPLPAHAITVQGRDVTARQYWWPHQNRSRRAHPPQVYAPKVRAMFDDVLRSALRAPGTVACELSGGLDSSAVVGAAAALARADPTIPPLVAHSMLYPGEAFDESAYIAAVREKWPLPWVGFEDLEQVDAHEQQALLSSIRYPIGFLNAGRWAQSRWAAANRCRVIVTGHGGDEVFWTAPLPFERERRPRWAGPRYFWWSSARSPRLLARRVRRELIRPCVPPWALRRYLRVVRDMTDDEQTTLTERGSELRRQLLAANQRKFGHPLWRSWWRPGELIGNALIDALNLRHGFEMRMPMMDVRFVGVVSSVPLLTHRWLATRRSLQRAAFGDVYPHAVGMRRTKAEFSALSLRALESAPNSMILAETGLVRLEGVAGAEGWSRLITAEVERWLTHSDGVGTHSGNRSDRLRPSPFLRG